uniref:Protein SCO1-like protein 2, mitochondrial n=1 Tax=Noccaea caerulescens TaxID=107243 RepID=A0A1J3FD54_NOCCA
MFSSPRLLLSCKHGANQAANFLRRSGPSRRIQAFNYSKSTRNSSHGRADANNPPFPIRTQAQAQAQASTPSRARYAAPALVLGFAGFISFLHYNDERRAVPKGQPSTSSNSGCGCGSNTTVKGPIIGGPFTLMSTQNTIVTEKDFSGKWVLLYFGYSFSPDLGPEQLKMMSKAVDKLESSHNQKIMPVFVTLDPLRDTPSHLHAYLKEFDSRILGITGSSSAVRQMAQEYRVYFKKVQEDGDDYLVDTSHNMYLLNPKMEVVRCFGVEYNPDELSREVLKEVTSVSQ